MTANLATGYCLSVSIADLKEILCLVLPASFRSSWEYFKGSGLSPNQKTRVEQVCAATVNRNGPAKGASPRALPNSSPGPKRLGPVTAPTVVAQTTKPIERPVLPAEGMSVAAKRA